jgi:hypothetical protein
MKLTLEFDSAILDKLETAAAAQKKPVKKLLEDNLEALAQLRPNTNQILLDGAHVSALSQAVGGKNLRSADDIVKLVQNCFRIRVNDCEIALTPEDLQMLKDQHTGFDFLTFEEYVKEMVLDGLSLHLWGSTRGTMALK